MNYVIPLLQICGDKNESHLWAHGFVLKVINSLDSQKLPLIEAQTEIALYLGKVFNLSHAIWWLH
jgi:hypothetical protein